MNGTKRAGHALTDGRRGPKTLHLAENRPIGPGLKANQQRSSAWVNLKQTMVGHKASWYLNHLGPDGSGPTALATPSHQTVPKPGLGARPCGGGVHPTDILRRCSVRGERS